MELPRRLPLRRAAKNSRTGRRGPRQRGVPYLGNPDADVDVALVVGLGNPGRKYRYTRHNMGRMAAEEMVDRSELIASGKWPDGRISLVRCEGREFLVLIPETFMNLSGRAAASVLQCYRIEPSRMLVIHDDIDLPLGEVRVKQGGGTAGHRGLASLVHDIGESGFRRVRMGVGRPPEGVDAAEYVLSAFDEPEREQAHVETERAAEAAFDLIRGAHGAG